MRLNRLTLQNFKGLDKLALSPMGGNMVVSGANGTGKTTIADAYAWVVFGKSFTGEAIEPEIKKRDPATGQTPNDGGVPHAVEAELALDDGRTVTLRKEYVEKWVKKRGQAESDFQGHTTNYSIDDVPMPKKEYDRRVGELVPEEAARLLSMPLYFCANLKWQERRKILMDIGGEVSNAQVMADNTNLAPLSTLAQGKSIDDYRLSLKAQMKKVNDELKSIPARIDELAQIAAATEGASKEALETELKALQSEHAKAAAKIARIENGGEAAERQKDLAKAEADLTAFKANAEAEYIKATAEAEAEAARCQAEISRLGEDMIANQEKQEQLAACIKTATEQRDKLRGDWFTENGQEFDRGGVEKDCPYCGQELPPGKLAEAVEKAEADFNLKKSGKLKALGDRGKAIKAQQEKDEATLEGLKAKLDEMQKQVDALADKKAEAEKVIAGAVRPDVENMPEYLRLSRVAAQIESEIERLRQGDAGELEKARLAATHIEMDIKTRQEKLAAIEQAKAIEKRKEELLAREKELGAAYTELERNLALAEKFVRAKVKAVEEAINSRFKYVRFTMFKQQINGGLEECCEPTINGVPFGQGLNTGGEMMAALDILNVLSEHYNLRLPVIIDNCERYTAESLAPLAEDIQLIRLVVAEGEKELRIESEAAA